MINSTALPMQEQFKFERPEFEGRIVGGNATTIDQIPYQVSLRSNNRHNCGGSIVSSKHVITAAHCINASPSRYSILAGSTTRTGDENQQLKQVSRLVRHPGYNSSPIDHDIAIVFVATEFEFNKFVQAIKLPEFGVIPEEGAIVTVSGWGTIRQGGGVLPNILQYVSKPIVGNARCNVSYVGRVKEGMLCAGTEEGGKDSCQGDSGGPLTLDGLLTGVVSWGRGCGQKGFPGVYTRVSHYVDWVSKTITSDE